MNAHTTKPQVMRALDRRYYVKRAGHWEPLEEETRWPLWLGWGVPILASWTLIAGAAWAWLG